MNNKATGTNRYKDNGNITLLYLIKFLWRKKLIIIIAALIVASAGALYTLLFEKSVYISSATLGYYVRKSDEQPLSNSEINNANSLFPTFIAVIKGDSVAAAAKEKLAAVYPYISIEYIESAITGEAVDNTGIYKIYVSTDDPKKSYYIMTAVLEAAPDKIIDAAQGGYVEVINSATYSSERSWRFVRNVTFGALSGIFIAVLFYTAAAICNQRVFDKEDVLAFGYRVIGTTPRLSPASDVRKLHKRYNFGRKPFKLSSKDTLAASADRKLIISDDTPVEILDSYRSIRSNILSLKIENSFKTIAFTGAEPAEGTTLTAINTAISMSQIGKKVLIIDANMRSPRVAGILSLPDGYGLSEYLSGKSDTANIVKTKYENLDAIMSGEVLNNSPELLFSEKFQLLMKETGDKYDYIFIDSPSVGYVTDALNFNNPAQGYILTAFSEICTKAKIANALDTLEQNNAQIIGIVLNGCNS